MLDRRERPPVEALAQAARLDLLGIALPEAYGGMNAGLLAHGLLLEELGKVCLSTAVAFNAHCAAAMAVATGGDGEQKQRILTPLARGDLSAPMPLASRVRVQTPAPSSRRAPHRQ